MVKTVITPEIANFIEINYRNEYGILAELSRKLKNKGYKISPKPIRNFIVESGFNYNGLLKASRTWSKKEIEILTKNCGNIPFPEIIKKVHSFNRRNKRTLRSERAIRLKCSELGLYNDVSGIYYTLTDISKRLGCSSVKMQNWLKDEKVKEILNIKDGKVHYKNLKKFLVSYRSEIVECNIDLEWVLGLFVDPIDSHF